MSGEQLGPENNAPNSEEPRQAEANGPNRLSTLLRRVNWLLVWTFLLVVGTGFQAFFSYQNSRSTMMGAWSQGETFRAEHRATLALNVNPAFGEDFVRDGQSQTAKFSVGVASSGKTDAMNVGIRSKSFEAAPKTYPPYPPDLPLFDFSPTTAADTLKNSPWEELKSIPPGGYLKYNTVPVSLERNGLWRMVYLIVQVRYCDVFRRPHFISQCAYFAVPSVSFTPDAEHCGLETDSYRDMQDEQQCPAK
jgi:hypothetical protein